MILSGGLSVLPLTSPGAARHKGNSVSLDVPRKQPLRGIGQPAKRADKECTALLAIRICPLKSRCCPNTPMRKIARQVHESARDLSDLFNGIGRVQTIASAVFDRGCVKTADGCDHASMRCESDVRTFDAFRFLVPVRKQRTYDDPVSCFHTALTQSGQ
jgi:hypothetical protein